VVKRLGGANVNDILAFDLGAFPTLTDSTAGNVVKTTGGLTIASYTDVGGVLSINFLTATQNQVDRILQGIQISNTTANGAVDYQYSFNDGEPTPTSQTDTDIAHVIFCTNTTLNSNIIGAPNGNVVNLAGGACNDQLSIDFNPATAVDNAFNNNLVVEGRGGSDLLQVNIGTSADIIEVFQNNTIVMNGAAFTPSSLSVDMNDVLLLEVTAQNATGNTINMFGGDGNDNIGVQFQAQNLFGNNLLIEGGGGTESINLNVLATNVSSGNQWSIIGGPGADNITVNGLAPSQNNLQLIYGNLTEIVDGPDVIMGNLTNNMLVFNFSRGGGFLGDANTDGALDGNLSTNAFWTFTATNDQLFYDTNGALAGGTLAVAVFTNLTNNLTTLDINFFP